METGSPKPVSKPDIDLPLEAVGGVDVLRQALLEFSRGGHPIAEELLRSVIQPISRQCHRDGVGPTTLVVEFKRLWLSLPEIDLLPRHDAQAILDRSVTILIEEYYAVD